MLPVSPTAESVLVVLHECGGVVGVNFHTSFGGYAIMGYQYLRIEVGFCIILCVVRTIELYQREDETRHLLSICRILRRTARFHVEREAVLLSSSSRSSASNPREIPS